MTLDTNSTISLKHILVKYANIVDENVHLNNNHNTVRLLYEGLSHLFTLLFLLLALRPKKCGFNVKHALNHILYFHP